MTNEELTALAADCEARAEAGEKPAHPGWNLCLESGSAQIIIAEQASCFHGNVPWFGIAANRSPAAYSMQTHPAYWSVSMQTLLNYCEPVSHQFSSLAAAQLFAEAFLREATAPLHAARIEDAARIAWALANAWGKNGDRCGSRLFPRIIRLDSAFADVWVLELSSTDKLRLNEVTADVLHPVLTSDARVAIDSAMAGVADKETQAKVAKFPDKIKIAELESHIAELKSLHAPTLRPMEEAPHGRAVLAWRNISSEWVVVTAFCGGTHVSSALSRENLLSADFSGWLPLPAPEGTK